MTAGKRSQSAELNQKEERAKSALHKAGQVVLEVISSTASGSELNMEIRTKQLRTLQRQ